MASQKLLQLLHPNVKSWGSLVRMYGSKAIGAQRLKKERENEASKLYAMTSTSQMTIVRNYKFYSHKSVNLWNLATIVSRLNIEGRIVYRKCVELR
jgi:hypothetical protein